MPMDPPTVACLCTLGIHEQYQQRSRRTINASCTIQQQQSYKRPGVLTDHILCWLGHVRQVGSSFHGVRVGAPSGPQSIAWIFATYQCVFSLWNLLCSDVNTYTCTVLAWSAGPTLFHLPHYPLLRAAFLWPKAQWSNLASCCGTKKRCQSETNYRWRSLEA